MRALPAALSLVFGVVQPVAAANGPWYEASVTCNPYDDYFVIQARAGAASGFTDQWIKYRHYVYRDGTGWFTLNPLAEGWIHHSTTDAVGWTPFGNISSGTPDAPGLEWRITPGQSGNYAVYTQYWWWDGTALEGPLGTWSNWVNYMYQPASTQTPWCNLDIEPPIIERDCPWCFAPM
jgi:hypothetical protein